MAKILLTGGGGFIGSHLAEELLSQGDVVSLADTDIIKNVSHVECENIQSDVRDRKTLEPCLREKDVVVHLAAVSRVEWGQEHPIECFETNVLSTLNILKAAGVVAVAPCSYWFQVGRFMEKQTFYLSQSPT